MDGARLEKGQSVLLSWLSGALAPGCLQSPPWQPRLQTRGPRPWVHALFALVSIFKSMGKLQPSQALWGMKEEMVRGGGKEGRKGIQPDPVAHPCPATVLQPSGSLTEFRAPLQVLVCGKYPLSL